MERKLDRDKVDQDCTIIGITDCNSCIDNISLSWCPSSINYNSFCYLSKCREYERLCQSMVIINTYNLSRFNYDVNKICDSNMNKHHNIVLSFLSYNVYVPIFLCLVLIFIVRVIRVNNLRRVRVFHDTEYNNDNNEMNNRIVASYLEAARSRLNHGATIIMINNNDNNRRHLNFEAFHGHSNNFVIRHHHVNERDINDFHNENVINYPDAGTGVIVADSDAITTTNIEPLNINYNSRTSDNYVVIAQPL